MASPILDMFDQMAANLAELRAEVVKAIQPPSQLDIVKVANSIELEQAFDSLLIGGDGGMIRCRPGVEYFVNLSNPERALNAPFIYITSDTEVRRPAGQMARREDVAGMAVIRAKDRFAPVFENRNKARNVAFSNIAFGPQANDRTVIALGGGRDTLKTPDDMASGFLFDHVVAIGDPVWGQHRFLQPHCKDWKVIDSAIYDYFEWNRDSQGIGAYNGCDGGVVDNVFIEAGAENIMFGGGGSASEAMNPRNIVMRRVHLSKDRRWASIPAPMGKTHMNVKCLLELKNVNGLTIDGIVMDENWRHTWPHGWAMALKSANQDGVEPWAECSNIDIRNVLVRDVGALISIVASHDAKESSRRMRNVKISNLLAIRMNQGEFAGTDMMAQFTNVPDGIWFDHWTVLDNSHSILNGEANGFNRAEPDTVPISVAITNSIFREGEYNVKWNDAPTGGGWLGKAALDAMAGTGKWRFEGNVLGKGTRSISVPGNITVPLADFVAAFDATGRLTPAAETFAKTVPTTDGKLPGADVAAIEAAAITR